MAALDFHNVSARQIQYVHHQIVVGGPAAGRPELPLFVNVPARPNLLVGRDAQYESLAARLAAGGSMALSTSGQGGAGKTTLAATLAYDARVHARFGDGVLWAALGPQPDTVRIQAEWGQALGVDLEGITDPHQRATQIRGAIGLRSLLIVIDDAWDTDSATLLRCGGPRCAHLLTTRDDGIARAFAGAAGAEKVRELGRDDAWTLLRTLAPEACGADEAAARHLVQSVGGLPLALELLGGYLGDPRRTALGGTRAAAFRELAASATRLRLASERLGARSRKKLSLEQVIELSIDALPAPARDAFLALGAFAAKPESFAANAAVAVAETGEDTLAQLIACNLLEPGEDGRLRVHQVLSDFARGKHSSAADRHRIYYLEFSVDRAVKNDWEALDREYAQIRHAWASLARQPDDGTLFLFGVALHEYQQRRGKWRDQLRLFRAALKTARRDGDADAIATLYNGIGHAQYRMGEQHAALKSLGRALDIRERGDDGEMQATVLTNIAAVQHELGDSASALESLQRALALHREAGHLGETTIVLNNIGLIHHELGMSRKGLRWLKEALAVQKHSKDPGHLATILHNLALVSNSMGFRRRALRYYRQSLEISEKLGDRFHVEGALNGIASVQRQRKKYGEALAWYRRALEVCKELEDRRKIVSVLEDMAVTVHGMGLRPLAIAYARQALELREAIGHHVEEANSRRNLAMIYREERRFADAIAEMQRAIRLAEADGSCDVNDYRFALRQIRIEVRVRDTLAKLLPRGLRKRLRGDVHPS